MATSTTPPSKAKVAALDASLTDYVAGFISTAVSGDIPKDVAHLGKRSVLDGLGLALAGAASQTGEIARKYLSALGFVAEGGSVVIGSDMRLDVRDQLVVALAFDALPARAINDLHVSLLVRWTRRTLPLSGDRWAPSVSSRSQIRPRR